MSTVQVIEEGTEQYVPVANLLVHESYGNPKSFENDIALWTLRQPANSNYFHILAISVTKEVAFYYSDL